MPLSPARLSPSKPFLSLLSWRKKEEGLRQAQPSRFWVLALVLLGLAWLASPAHAQTFPPLSGRVVDTANLLSPEQEAALTTKLEGLETSTDRQLVVATIPDLQGYPVEDYGYRLGRAWGIGQKQENNGAILLVALNDRKMRIEVGYGLEPYLTDALSSVIIRDQMRPKFKTGDYAGGIRDGVDAIIAQLQLPQEEAQARQGQILAAERAKQGERRSSSGGGFPLGLIFWGMVVVSVLLSMRRGRKKRGVFGSRRYSRGSNLPVWLWVASEMAAGAARSSGGGMFGGGGGGGWGGGGGGGFSGGGGSFGGGGASGDW